MTEFQRMLYLMREGFDAIADRKDFASEEEREKFRTVLESWEALPHPPAALSDPDPEKAPKAYSNFR